MRTIILSLCTIVMCSQLIVHDLSAQSKRKIRKMLQQAEEKLMVADYEEVTEICEEIAGSNPKVYKAHYLLGVSYYELNEIKRALYHYEIIPDKYKARLRNFELNLALAYHSLSQFEKALSSINRYLEHYNFDDKNNLLYQKALIVRQGIQMALDNRNRKNDNIQFDVAQPPISSVHADYSISFGPDTDKLIVNVASDGNRNNVKYTYQDSQWKNVYEYDEFEYLNSRKPEGQGTMSADGKTFVFSRCDKNNIGCKLYIAKKIKGVWSKPKPLPEIINIPGYEFIDPSLSLTGDTLFFSSDRKGGKGSYDIWYAKKDDSGTWSGVYNFGDAVNTPFDEVAPYYEPVEKTLYFSSDGHPGYGKMDIFVYDLENDELINPDRPINSGYDDKYFIVKEDIGYLASNRPGGVGDFDIYRFNIPEQNEKQAWNGQKMERLYAAIFAFRLYDIPVKLMPADHAMFDTIDEATRSYLISKAEENIQSLSNKATERIKNEDQMLYTSMREGEKDLVDYIVKAYFSDIKKINQYRSFAAKYDALSLEEKRKFDRVIANRIKANKHIKRIVKSQSQNEPLQSKKGIKQAAVKKTTPSLPQEDHIVNTLNTQKIVVPEEETFASSNTEHSKSNLVNNKEEKFADFLGIKHSVKYYQKLPFKERKRVDRIVAIRLVNEQYTLNPALRISDQQYYNTLSHNEKQIVNRLKLYFQSWSEQQQKSNLDTQDVQYLSTLPEDKKEIIARLVVRKGIGVDVDNFVKFSGSDWQKYKHFTALDIEKIKQVANLLKSRNQVFNVALAYVSPDEGRNNNSVKLVDNTPASGNKYENADPITYAVSSVKFESLFFNPKSTDLRKEVIVALNDLVSVFNNNPSLTFKLSAISADAGTEAANLALSQSRLESVRDYLIEIGIPSEKIFSKAFTADHINNIWDFEHMMNRRVDVFAEGNNGSVTSDYTTYMIQPGNTLYGLSKASDMTVSELKKINGLEGTTIYAHHPMRVKKNADLKNEYMVESSSGLYYQQVNLKKISTNNEEREYDIPDEVKENIERGERLYSIDVNKTSEQSQNTVHIVRRGEQLKQIANYYNVSIETIMQANDLEKRKVKEGQRLIIKK